MNEESFSTEIREAGRAPDGSVQFSDTRLYMQLHCFDGCADPDALVEAARESGWDLVLYQDAVNPWGVALLSMSTDASFFAGDLAGWMRKSAFAALRPRSEAFLFGRAYAIGYERNLEHVLVHRSRERALNPAYPWAVWYPLRRNGAFAKLGREEKMKILGEHGTIGRAFGEKDLAHDIRLACFGMDRNDNDFMVGLVGGDLLPLSKVVETMRSTVQTSMYIEQMGPFFAGKALYQSPLL